MNEDQVLAILDQDPGNSIFVDYAEILHRENRSDSAIMVCLRGLSHNPSLHKARLLLAKIYFELGFRPFCVEQLKMLLVKLPNNKHVLKLLEKIAPGEAEISLSISSDTKTYAEAEFDFGDIELIESDGK